MKPSHILALDQGTTSSRTLVVDHDGLVVATAQREFKQHYPKPGWVEHDPREIWSSQSATMAEALSKADLTHRDIAAIGITNQRETTVVWDRKTGRPIHPAIVWQDRRTADFCARLKREGREETFAKKTGLRLDPYFSGTKLSWILEHIEGARDRAEAGELRFGTIDSWLVWKLTGGQLHVTDATNASRTLLYDIFEQRWDDELLEILGIPRSMLPEVRSSSEVYGETEDGVPIAGIAGDQHAALFGQACFEPGMAKNTYGTGCFLLMHTGEEPIRSENNLLTTIAWKIGDHTEYALEGSTFMGGAIVQWLRDELRLVSSAEECSRLAGEIPDAGGMYLVPAFAGLGSPHWDPYARGTCVGMTRGTNRRHFCRAALEAIAFQSADLAECMTRDSGIAMKQLRVDGGASRSEPLLRFQCDLLGIDVVRPENIETTAMGAAYLAGLAVGFWESKDDITRRWKPGLQLAPERPEDEMKTLAKGWNRAVGRAKDWELPEDRS